MSQPSARMYSDLSVSPASWSTAYSGTPVHSLALRIIASEVREGRGPSPLKNSKKVASDPEHSITVRTVRPGNRRRSSKDSVRGFLTSPSMVSDQSWAGMIGGTSKCCTV